MGSSGLRLHCVKSTHCTNYFLRKEKKNDIIYHGFFFYKIHLPFWPLQSQEEHPVPCVAKTPVIALGPRPSVGQGAICTRLRAVRRCLSELSTDSSAELGCPQPSLFPFCSGVLEPLSAKSPGPHPVSSWLQAPASTAPMRSGPLQSDRTAPWRGDGEHFLGDFLSATGQSSQETREVVHGE